MFLNTRPGIGAVDRTTASRPQVGDHPEIPTTRPHSGFTFGLVIIGDETAFPLIATKNGVALN
jgi:hypothetical protein